jgi:hypothetical protein
VPFLDSEDAAPRGGGCGDHEWHVSLLGGPDASLREPHVLVAGDPLPIRLGNRADRRW